MKTGIVTLLMGIAILYIWQHSEKVSSTRDLFDIEGKLESFSTEHPQQEGKKRYNFRMIGYPHLTLAILPKLDSFFLEKQFSKEVHPGDIIRVSIAEKSAEQVVEGDWVWIYGLSKDGVEYLPKNAVSRLPEESDLEPWLAGACFWISAITLLYSWRRRRSVKY